MSLSTRIRAALDSGNSLTQAGLARACGISRASVNAWVNGKTDSIDGKFLTTAAAYLGVQAHWLSTGEGDMLPRQLAATGFAGGTFGTPSIANTSPVLIDLENNPDYPAIRRVKFKLSAGASGFGLEYPDEEDDLDGAPIVFRRQWYVGRGLQPDKLFAVKVANGSMEPGLHDGDTVVVNTASTEPKDGVVFAVNYEGELVIKRLMRDAGQWWLASDNADQRRYPRKVCDEHSVLIGEIVHKQSERI